MMLSFNFTPIFFVIKDRHTRHTVLHDKCRNRLYSIPSPTSSSGKLCYSVTKPSTEQCHYHLGHPSFKTFTRILRTYDLPFESNKFVAHVCDACQQVKSHQLLFLKSVSVSKASLELVFSDVWGSTPSSIGNNNYYVCFIDDFSKFT
jgi:hypothetical protein